MAKVMISLPDDLLEELDKAAEENHKRRSELIKDLALEFLRGQKMAFPVRSEEAFDRLREFQFKLSPGETAEGLIRHMRDSR
ncbi:MAG: ribbon-helix-helix protein, CopG family [Deltaproteobacteria bacterium]|nr:ribbon-helix-helix protein, CopG family [Deltaproteobacteria bacterium]